MTGPSGNLATEARIAWLQGRLEQEGSLRLGLVASELEVSEMTVRRDLQLLEARGLARRVRGGAVAVGPAPFAERHRAQAKAKARIAAKLVDLVPGEGPIAVDASSTLMRLITQLAPDRDLVVVTNGLESFTALTAVPGVRAVVTGGELEPGTGTLVGPLAVRTAGQLLLRRLFVSAAGVDPILGSGEVSLEESEVKQAFARVADEIVLAVDSTKLGLRGAALGLELSQVTYLVTELDPGHRLLAPYKDVVDVL